MYQNQRMKIVAKYRYSELLITHKVLMEILSERQIHISQSHWYRIIMIVDVSLTQTYNKSSFFDRSRGLLDLLQICSSLPPRELFLSTATGLKPLN